ncbi:dihydroxy-acid dehydratase [Thalassococcus sp. BH17M4-6]|uniref:dihydroxy-acid dehydratase n=1 Tax=Thalassococcus sp. BH17M4-6 TaxID=3413148 RepID=UPI003BBCD803
MWRAILASVLVIGALAGCEAAPAPDPEGPPSARTQSRGFLSGLIGPVTRTGPAALSQVRLARGDVIVSATEGYCIDPETLVTRGGRGFAMLASCRILNGGETGPLVPPLLVTVTVGPAGSGADLPEPETLAAISEAPLLDAASDDGLVLARLGRGGEGVLDGGDPRYWRGAFTQGSRLVILALYAPEGSVAVGPSGRALLARVHARIRAESP